MSYVRFYSTASFSLNVLDNGGNWDGTMEYSTNANSWASWNGNSITAVATSGTYNLYLRGTGNHYITTGDFVEDIIREFEFTGTQPIDCEGNIESLLDYQTVDNGQHPQMYEYAFYMLFSNCTLLRTAPTLPATTLTNSCYTYMFDGCTSLTTPPSILPATTLTNSCYYGMFYGCTSLITAPELPATTLATYCYYGMFQGCTSLTTAPELPATTLNSSCYSIMFDGCTSLTTPPSILPATTLANSCYDSMFYGCTSLTTSPKLPAIKLATNCYQYMFYGCTGLISVSALPAIILANTCYARIFNGSNITLTTTPDSTHTTEFRIPMVGTISTTATNWNTNMFPTSSAVRAPDINTTYYINVTLIDPSIDYMVTKSELSSIATAIREKTGNNIPLTYPDDFISELNNIQPGEMTTFLSGSSLPASSLGVDGDFYTYTGS